MNSYDQRDSANIFIGRIGERPFPTGTSDNNLRRSYVGVNSPFSVSQMTEDTGTYNGLALMSLDGLLRPVSLSGADGLPRYSNYIMKSNTGLYGGGSSHSVPPFYVGSQLRIPTGNGTITGLKAVYNNKIYQSYLNPLTNPTGYGLSFSSRNEIDGTGGQGHDIELLGHRTGDLPSGYSMVTSIGDGNGTESYSNDYKFLALRGPLVIGGWGYDTDGKPIPNAADTYANASSGIYTNTNLQDYFLPGFLQKSNTWPVGPVDLRWDRRRGVWTAPPSEYLTFQCELRTHLFGGYAFNTPSIRHTGWGVIMGPVDKNKGFNFQGSYHDTTGRRVLVGNFGATTEDLGFVPIVDTVGRAHLSGSIVNVRWDSVAERYHIVNEQVHDIVRIEISNGTGFYDEPKFLCSGSEPPYLTVTMGQSVNDSVTYSQYPCWVDFSEYNYPWYDNFYGIARVVNSGLSTSPNGRQNPVLQVIGGGPTADRLPLRQGLSVYNTDDNIQGNRVPYTFQYPFYIGKSSDYYINALEIPVAIFPPKSSDVGGMNHGLNSLTISGISSRNDTFFDYKGFATLKPEYFTRAFVTGNLATGSTKLYPYSLDAPYVKAIFNQKGTNSLPFVYDDYPSGVSDFTKCNLFGLSGQFFPGYTNLINTFSIRESGARTSDGIVFNALGENYFNLSGFSINENTVSGVKTRNLILNLTSSQMSSADTGYYNLSSNGRFINVSAGAGLTLNNEPITDSAIFRVDKSRAYGNTSNLTGITVITGLNISYDGGGNVTGIEELTKQIRFYKNEGLWADFL